MRSIWPSKTVFKTFLVSWVTLFNDPLFLGILFLILLVVFLAFTLTSLTPLWWTWVIWAKQTLTHSFWLWGLLRSELVTPFRSHLRSMSRTILYLTFLVDSTWYQAPYAFNFSLAYLLWGNHSGRSKSYCRIVATCVWRLNNRRRVLKFIVLRSSSTLITILGLYPYKNLGVLERLFFTLF